MSNKYAPKKLTPKETLCRDLMAEGLSNPAIAKRLSISVSTVKGHMHRLFKKYGVKTRYALIAKLRWTATDLPVGRVEV